ncbi:MAG: TonB-dependent receptor [Steroidobacteraceae bacterium]
MTQESLDRQGIQSVADLSRSMPAVTFRQGPTGDRISNISIRGIVSIYGAPTTGIYLDDTPLQKRLANGATTGSGSPLPVLFDLDRVEVLRGPQGTLYGGSSQGGTVRFITPTPSLTEHSIYTKAEVTQVSGGDMGFSAGFAFGGPLIQDRVGVRISAYGRRTPGYVDHVSMKTAQTLARNSNWGDAKMVRGTLLWKLTDNLSITPALYYSSERSHDPDQYWQNIPAYSTLPQSYNNSAYINPATGVPWPNVVFPGVTDGPYNQFGRYRTGVNFVKNGVESAAFAPRENSLLIPSLTIDLESDTLSLRSITSYVEDRAKGNTATMTGVRNNVYNGTALVNGVLRGTIVVVPGFDYWDNYFYTNSRTGIAQEIRLTSVAGDSPFSWVAGGYYSNFTNKVDPTERSNDDEKSLFVSGVPFGQRSGSPVIDGDIVSHRYQEFKETEAAVFGEIAYRFTPRWKATLGSRYTRNTYDYYQFFEGPLAGPASPVTVTGDQKENSFTPKVGLDFQVSEHNLLYTNIARGFRPGGTNAPIPVTNCAVDLAVLGGAQPPASYSSDTVTSFEVGAKVRAWGGRAQVNSSLFYIDWQDIQTQTRLRNCGFQYVVNGAEAISKGGDIQAQVLVTDGLILSTTIGYNDAYYKDAVLGPVPPAGVTRQILFNKGDSLGAPKWTYSVGAQYNGRLTSDYGWYLQANYQYQGPYFATSGPGTLTYDEYSYRAMAIDYVNARVGLTRGGVDVAFFVNNLTNSHDLLSDQKQPYGVQITQQTLTPRTIGLSLTYRH